MIDGAPLSLFPERRPHWGSFAASFGLQALAVVVLVKAGIVQPQMFVPAARHYTLTALVTTPPPQRPAPPPPRKLLHITQPETIARLTLPATPHQPQVQPETAPRPQLERARLSEVLPPSPARVPVQVVRTGMFGSTGSQAVASVNKPVQQVQTGGFGDPNGVKGEGKPGARATIASAGSFDLPAGPGYGNGSGGARGVRGTVASVGFGNGVAIGNSDRESGGSGRGTIQQGGFGDARPVTDVPRAPRPTPVAASTTPVQIVSKPTPIYTDEARKLRLEGEVLLEVLFAASGECHVQRVLRGLGHGLDEAAARAAQQIRFRPAMRSGQPVDSIASLHVTFQLAY